MTEKILSNKKHGLLMLLISVVMLFGGLIGFFGLVDRNPLAGGCRRYHRSVVRVDEPELSGAG